MRPRRCDNLQNNSAAAKRSRLERIVRPRLEELIQDPVVLNLSYVRIWLSILDEELVSEFWSKYRVNVSRCKRQVLILIGKPDPTAVYEADEGITLEDEVLGTGVAMCDYQLLRSRHLYKKLLVNIPRQHALPCVIKVLLIN